MEDNVLTIESCADSRPATHTLFSLAVAALCARRPRTAVWQPCLQRRASRGRKRSVFHGARSHLLSSCRHGVVRIDVPCSGLVRGRPPSPPASCRDRRAPPAPSLPLHDPQPPPRRHALRLSARPPPAKDDVPSCGLRAALRPVSPPPSPLSPPQSCGLRGRDILHGGSAALSAEAMFLAAVNAASPTVHGLGSPPLLPSHPRGLVRGDVRRGHAHGSLICWRLFSPPGLVRASLPVKATKGPRQALALFVPT